MRYFLRLISQHAVLYTEMVTVGAILHGDRDRFLRFNDSEHPVALQLGGSDIKDLKACCKIASTYGYDEINLNVGCPSDKVQSGMFGACLMAKPDLVADCVEAMMSASDVPVTVKSRIGIDDADSYDELSHFIDTIAKRGCKTFVIHARKAILSGLSPKQNRDVPPLNYPFVYQIKQDFPQLEIIINGGITSLAQSHAHLAHVDGVMVGREAYHNPYLLAEVDQQLYGDDQPIRSKTDIFETFLDYVDNELSQGVKLQHISRHILGLFSGSPGARLYRRHISENAHQENADTEVLRKALGFIHKSD